MGELMDRLKLGERFTVSLPSELDEEGLNDVYWTLFDILYKREFWGKNKFGRVAEPNAAQADEIRHWLREEVGLLWSTKRGTYPKRLSNYLFKTHKIKLEEGELTKVGNIAKRHSGDGDESYEFDFTDKFNWKAGDYGDDGSCFWGGRAVARNVLEGVGAKAIRYYGKKNNGYDQSPVGGMGRAWILPVETDREGDRIAVINSYGVDILKTARLLSTWLGTSYKQATIYNKGTASGDLFINSGRGYILGLPQAIQKVDVYDFNIVTSDYHPTCERCHQRTPAFMRYDVTEGHDYCRNCFNDLFLACGNCVQYHERSQENGTDDRAYDEVYVCQRCIKTHGCKCGLCHRTVARTRTYSVQVRVSEELNESGLYHQQSETWCRVCAAGLELRRCQDCSNIYPDAQLQNWNRVDSGRNALGHARDCHNCRTRRTQQHEKNLAQRRELDRQRAQQEKERQQRRQNVSSTSANATTYTIGTSARAAYRAVVSGDHNLDIEEIARAMVEAEERQTQRERTVAERDTEQEQDNE